MKAIMEEFVREEVLKRGEQNELNTVFDGIGV